MWDMLLCYGALDRKMQEWHDDDWYEGIND